ncbi:MAG: FAD-dependent monooxygenase [Chloroflexia bacterium]|nr:FAD-dependent monooxygenase [Chloroflexia bacterium]
MTMVTTRPRTLIIGAGISGPVTAMFLQRAGWEVAVYEARDRVEMDEGAFLNLAPNGVNVLKLLGIDIEREADGFPASGLTFFNTSGKELGAIDSRDDEARFGARSVVLKRANLHRALHAAAAVAGVPFHFGKRLTGIEQRPDRVVATFADGTTAAGDVLIGCDGIHSRTRHLILPRAPKPVYTGIVDCGAFVTPAPPVPPTPAMRMVFGDNAFVGYLARPDGEVYWFCNVAWAKEPARGELDAISSADWKHRLSGLLAGEADPILRIVATTTGEIGKWPIYDIPSLPTWHQGRVCLIGDAAHATSPHVGQGASTALEDAAELARCLRDISTPTQAFVAFERIRKDRVEKLVARARRTGSQKAVTNPVQAWFRDRLLGLFLRFGKRSNDWIYAYRVPWNEPVTG